MTGVPGAEAATEFEPWSGVRFHDRRRIPTHRVESPGGQPSRAHGPPFAPVKGGWGRGGATNVRLRAAKKGAVREALITAWRNRAPKRLAQQLDHS